MKKNIIKIIFILPFLIISSCTKASDENKKEEVINEQSHYNEIGERAKRNKAFNVDDMRTLVQVGDDVITAGDLHRVVSLLIPEGKANITEKEYLNLRKNLLNQMIEEKIVILEAKRLNVEITDEEFEEELERLYNENLHTGLENAVLEHYATIEEWKKDLKQKMLIKKTVFTVLDERVKISGAEAYDFYQVNIRDYEVPAQVHARQILIKDRQEAEKIRKELTRKNFADMASQFSRGPEAGDGGDLGYFARGDMPPEFEEVVFAMRKNEISKVIKTRYGYHIFYLEAKKQGRRLYYRAVKDEIIATMKKNKMDAEFTKWMSELKQTLHIKIEEKILYEDSVL